MGRVGIRVWIRVGGPNRSLKGTQSVFWSREYWSSVEERRHREGHIIGTFHLISNVCGFAISKLLERLSGLYMCRLTYPTPMPVQHIYTRTLPPYIRKPRARNSRLRTSEAGAFPQPHLSGGRRVCLYIGRPPAGVVMDAPISTSGPGLQVLP